MGRGRDTIIGKSMDGFQAPIKGYERGKSIRTGLLETSPLPMLMGKDTLLTLCTSSFLTHPVSPLFTGTSGEVEATCPTITHILKVLLLCLWKGDQLTV